MAAWDFTRANWRTSSYSGSNTNCVEVAFLDDAWRTSSYSGSNTDCVELARDAGHVGVRDSKNATGPVLVFDTAPFAEFLRTF